MKKASLNLAGLYLAVFFFTACGPSPVNQQEAQQNVAIAMQQEKVQIQLDETIPGAATSLTRNFYFVFDGSASMGNPPDNTCSGDRRFSTKIEGAQWAVREFMKNVPSDVNLGLYVFDWNNEKEVVSLGPGNHQKFLQEVGNIVTGDGTPLADGMRVATEHLVEQYKRQLGYGEFRLIVVTDGIASGIPEASLNAIRHGIPIYAIGLCIGENHPLRQYALSYQAADSAEDLRRGLEQTLAELSSFDVQEFQPAEAGSAK